MERKLSNIFKTNSREARKAILDKFDITKEDKQEVLNRIDSSGGGEGGDDTFDIRYVDLRGISDKAVRSTISSCSDCQFYYNRLKGKIGIECITANVLYPLNTDDLAFNATYTMACRLDMQTIVEYNISLRDYVLDWFDVDIETLPTLSKEEFLNLRADDYNNWAYNHQNQPFYD